MAEHFRAGHFFSSLFSFAVTLIFWEHLALITTVSKVMTLSV